MSSSEKLGIVIKYEFLKHIRRRRLYIILGIALLVETLVLILIPGLNHWKFPTSVNVMAAILTVGPSLGVLGAVFFAGDAIAGEYEGKTGFLLFTNPIRKDLLWLGKYIAGFIAVTLLIIFVYIIIAISLVAIYQKVPSEILQSFGLCLYYAAAVLSTTFFFSSVSKGSMGATIITLLFIFVFGNILESVLAYTHNPYWFVLNAGGDTIAQVYGNMRDFMQSLGGGNGNFQQMMNYSAPSLGMASWGMTIYFVGGFIASIFISRRRQLA